MPDTAPPKRRRHIRWIVGILTALVLLFILLQSLLGSIIRQKLISTVQSQTNATLQFGTVTYLPPYGIRVDNANFLAGNTSLVKIKHLELKLARFPFRPGPLVIQRITVDSPEVRLINTSQGLLGIDNLLKQQVDINQKLSDLFELRHLAITSGQITYEDQSHPHALPIVWKNLSINTETRPTSAGVYSYDFHGQQASLSTIQSAGTFDIDNLLLNAKSLALNIQVSPGQKESSVPAPLQKILAEYQLQGALKITGQGRVPLKQLTDANYQFEVSLENGRGRVPHYDRPIDKLQARLRVTGKAKQAISTLVALEAVSGPDVLHVDDGDLAVDLNQKSWDLKRLNLRLDASAVGVRPFQIPTSTPATQQKLRAGGRMELTAAGTGSLDVHSPADFLRRAKFDMVATASDFHIQPPGLPAPIQLVTGSPIIANQDVLRVSNLTGQYGNDQFQITTLRIPLRDLPQIARIEQITVSATFDRHTPAYPGIAGKWIKKINPEGPFEVGGSVAYDQGASPKLSYHLLLHSDRGAIEYTDNARKIPVSRIHAEAMIDTGTAQLDYLEANVFGGLVRGTGSAKITDPITWQAKGQLRDFDLRTSAEQLTGKQFSTDKLAGRAFLSADMAGSMTPQSVKGTGEARLVEGRIFEIPILTEILSQAGLQKGLIGSDAAATFALADGKLNLKKIALGSAAIGVQGHGTIAFDKTLDLDVVVAPLGQWKDRFKRTGIPIVSKVIGDVAGVVQSAVNAAASTFLYEFHVSGTADAPKIAAVPAPFLTKSGAAIFSAMLGGDDNALADQVKQPDDEPADKPAQ
ncbi:MAG TPA: AsmA-like C-terminal region-containing protein [Tepidisphaeraceae bacterium]|nr:AsmA-like C-terminal region-containing protein [Tepidisphaeraceae bacterium]